MPSEFLDDLVDVVSALSGIPGGAPALPLFDEIADSESWLKWLSVVADTHKQVRHPVYGHIGEKDSDFVLRGYRTVETMSVSVPEDVVHHDPE